MKLAGRVLVGLVTLVAVLPLVVFAVSEWKLSRSWDVPVATVETSDDSVTIAAGRHVAEIRGCLDCHGEDLSGRLFADAMPILRVSGTNLTRGQNGIGATYSDEDFVRAIRSGVRPDGSALLLMPSMEYRAMGPQDLGALISFVRSVPPVDTEPVDQTLGPIGRALYLMGQAPVVPAELIDHADGTFRQPDVAATEEYGEYIAIGCTGCHGADYTGGPMPGNPPGVIPANLTPDVETGIGSWSREDFMSFFVTGVRPDGTTVDPMMPWQIGSSMTEIEREALWMYLQSLPPTRVEHE